MKKVYAKPVFAIQMFGMAQSITQDCGSTTIPESQIRMVKGSYVWDLGGGQTVFVSTTNCMIDGSIMGFECYNNPTANTRVFRAS